MASQEVVRFDDEQITGMTRYAKAYSGSSFFKDAASVEKAFVLISAGSEIGIAPFASITGISLIQGKPVIGAGILAGLVKSHPHYDYRVRRLDDTGCVIAFFQDGDEIGESSFTIDDAKRAGLAGKDVWKNYPRNMMFARAISNGVAFYTPDVTTTRVYTEGELDDIPAPAASGRKPAAVPTATPTPETVVDAELVPEAPAVAAAESAAPDANESASGTSTPVERAKAAYAACSKEEKAAVKDACKQIGIAFGASQLVARFGTDAESRETLLPALAAAVNPPAQVEGEISPSAESFDEFLKDDTARNIEAAEQAQAEAAARIGKREQMAQAGSYGES